MSIRTASMLLEHTECFPNLIRSLSEYPESYSEGSEIAQRCTYKHFKLPNAEPNAQFAPRTHRMLPEYDPFAFRTLKFIFGKHSESIRPSVIAPLYNLFILLLEGGRVVCMIVDSFIR